MARSCHPLPMAGCKQQLGFSLRTSLSPVAGGRKSCCLLYWNPRRPESIVWLGEASAVDVFLFASERPLEQVTIWGLDSDALRQIAHLLGVSVIVSHRPSLELQGRGSVRWTTEFVSRLAELDQEERKASLEVLGEILHERAEPVLESLVELCRKAVTLEVRVLQAEPYP